MDIKKKTNECRPIKRGTSNESSCVLYLLTNKSKTKKKIGVPMGLTINKDK